MFDVNVVRPNIFGCVKCQCFTVNEPAILMLHGRSDVPQFAQRGSLPERLELTAVTWKVRQNTEHFSVFLTGTLCNYDVIYSQMFVRVEVVVVTLSFWGAGEDETDLVVVTTGRAGRSFVDYCSFPSLCEKKTTKTFF